MSEEHIVKVQRAIQPDNGMILIYAKGRENMQETNISTLSKSARKVMESTTKRFFHARWIDGKWSLGLQTPWQDW